jgi:hypothetical protein
MSKMKTTAITLHSIQSRNTRRVYRRIGIIRFAELTAAYESRQAFLASLEHQR